MLSKNLWDCRVPSFTHELNERSLRKCVEGKNALFSLFLSLSLSRHSIIHLSSPKCLKTPNEKMFMQVPSPKESNMLSNKISIICSTCQRRLNGGSVDQKLSYSNELIFGLFKCDAAQKSITIAHLSCSALLNV